MKRFTTIVLTIFWLLVNGCLGYAYWIWTPKTGKWINPKYSVKPTPTEHLEYAKELYGASEYKQAEREFKKLVKSYPRSLEAAEAQFYLGLCYQARGNLYRAYLAYQKVVDKYPFSERIQEVIEREYKIAEKFMQEKRRRLANINLPVENPAIEIFRKVIDNSTYGPYAAVAQYKLGLLLKGLKHYSEAIEEFEKVISNYPDSEWVGPAKFQIASCQGNLSRSPEYDQEATRQARERFEEFLRQHPDAVLSRDARGKIEELRLKEAESNFAIAYFYEKQKAYKAAKLYYEDIIKNYPRSVWANKARQRLEMMEE
jgi:outer membrane protein assembly factor BamD